jgi:taurine transport system permease protein
MKLRYRFAISFLSVAAVLLLWQAAGVLKLLNPLLLPPPSEIIATAADMAVNGYMRTSLWRHILISVARAFFAFFMAILAGVPIGLLMGVNPVIRAAIDPFVQFTRPLPKIALIPLVIVWFGIGELSKFFLIFLSSLLSIIVGAAAAVGGVAQSRVRVAQMLGANRRQIFFNVILPNTLPELFTSVRLSIGVGWTALVAAELVASDAGLGWMVMNAGDYLRTDVVILGILFLGLIGYALDLLLVFLQKRCVPWTGKEA